MNSTFMLVALAAAASASQLISDKVADEPTVAPIALLHGIDHACPEQTWIDAIS